MFSDWASLLKARNDWTQNADLPVLTPWTVAEGKEKHTGNLVLQRNPYSIWVDIEGNQLPYLDRISMSNAESFEAINERAAAGEYDLQDNELWATHLADEVAAEDRVVLLHRGSVRFSGCVPRLLEVADATTLRTAFMRVTDSAPAGAA